MGRGPSCLAPHQTQTGANRGRPDPGEQPTQSGSSPRALDAKLLFFTAKLPGLSARRRVQGLLRGAGPRRLCLSLREAHALFIKMLPEAVFASYAFLCPPPTWRLRRAPSSQLPTGFRRRDIGPP